MIFGNKPWGEAQKHLAGGVNSPVRAFGAVGGDPIFIERAKGPYLYDSRGKKYIDYCLSWGAILLGHAEKQTVRAIQKQVLKGTSYGAVTEYETALAKEIKKAFSGMEKMRFTSSGTEAAMSAIRLARGVTKKDRIVKFEGCYHGHADGLLVKAGSGVATFATPGSAGVPKSIASLTSVLPYNDTQAVETFFKKRNDVACVIVEPIAANMGVVPAHPEFLAALRYWTKKKGALLILDEVISGFRVGYGGAQHLYGIEPDLTVLGKIIGGGLPVGAFGAKKAIMNHLSPAGDVYQAGTLSGNPLSMAAGRSVLSRLTQGLYQRLEKKSDGFIQEAAGILEKRQKKAVIQRVGSMFTIFFGTQKVSNFKEALGSDKKEFRQFFHRMLSAGIYVPPSAYEAYFISEAHTDAVLGRTLEVLKGSL